MGWLDRWLLKADVRNQVMVDAIAGRYSITGPGVLFEVSSQGREGEIERWSPRVRIDGGPPHRIPSGTSFMAMTAGRHALRVENGSPRPWCAPGTAVIVEVPNDGYVRLEVRTDYWSGWGAWSGAPRVRQETHSSETPM